MANPPVIRPYEHGDRGALMQLMTQLQTHLCHLDQHGAHRTLDEFDANKYVDSLLRKVQHHNGIILLAFEELEVMGCIIGTMNGVCDDDLLHKLPVREAHINEMVVDMKHHGKKVGEALIAAMEEYFRAAGCETVRVGCYAANTKAHTFYHGVGYEDRLIELVKKL